MGSREAKADTELVQRMAELRQEGRSPKEVARVLGLRPADVMPVIRAVAAQAPKREAPVAGCWVTGHWADNLGVTGHPAPVVEVSTDVPHNLDGRQP